MSSRYSVALVTCPAGAAEKVARRILEERTAACVNIVSGVRSQYWWKGKVEKANECLLVIKTKTASVKRLERVVRSVHPYEVPEMIAFGIDQGSKPYLDWIGKEAR